MTTYYTYIVALPERGLCKIGMGKPERFMLWGKRGWQHREQLIFGSSVEARKAEQAVLKGLRKAGHLPTAKDEHQGVDGQTEQFPIDALDDMKALLAEYVAGLDDAPQARPEVPVVALDAESEANADAARLLADVYLGLLADGYPEQDLDTLTIRLLFALYADDSGIITPRGMFGQLVLDSAVDGSDLGPAIAKMFDVMNTPEDKRQKRDKPWPYINGGMFRDRITIADFSDETRAALLRASQFDWSNTNPIIFGNVFQAVKDPEQRHQLGAHYTHIDDIMDTLRPLILDDLRADLDAALGNRDALETFLSRLANIDIMDPACGSGNFLMVAYREIRRLETEAIVALHRVTGRWATPSVVSSQFHGMELDEFSASIALTSMWLAVHSEDQRYRAATGQALRTFPIANEESWSNIKVGSAAAADWQAEFGDGIDFIVGNPPYLGADQQNAEQRDERKAAGVDGGKMDYAGVWMVKAGAYIKTHPDTRAAYVITTTVTRGTNVAGLWKHEGLSGLYVQFARQHRAWPGDAKTRVVTVGIGTKPEARELRDGEGNLIPTDYIDLYLLPSRVPSNEPIRMSLKAPAWLVGVRQGNAYEDFGHYTKLGDDLETIRRDHPEMLISKVSATNLLSGKDDPVLWFGNRSAAAVAHPAIAPRVAAVAERRGEGHKKGPEWIPGSVTTQTVMAIPRTLSAGYEFLPVVMTSGYLVDKVYYAPLDWFSAGIYMSKHVRDYLVDHVALMANGGDVQVSTQIIYGMDEPRNDTPELREAIAEAAEAAYAAREGAAAADCLKARNMTPRLREAHARLDALVAEFMG